MNPFEEAKRPGGKHHVWYKRQLTLPDSMLEKAIRSFERLIAEHQSWIENPTMKYPDFYQWDSRRQKNLIEHHWPADISRHREFVSILEGLLQERRHGDQ